MSTIVIMNGEAIVSLGDQDDEGNLLWRCLCGTTAERPMAGWDAVMDADAHVQHRCPRRP